jgi:phenylglyoxylate dehydrogenase epsilon subunit
MMNTTKYLIVGSSHAALEAADAIRAQDPDGRLVMATRDNQLPYSPTVLPYVVSGKSASDNVALRQAEDFDISGIEYLTDANLIAIDPEAHVAKFDDIGDWQYEKLLLATGASPSIPPITGIDSVPYLVLRTLDDAIALRDALGNAKRALVLGAGLIGMHAAENLIKGDAEVTIVERAQRVLPDYFPAEASEKIAEAFREGGVTLLLGRTVVGVSNDNGVTATFDNGDSVSADLLLVATGVTPNMGFAAQATIDTDHGILVNETMRTSQSDIWAAGDVAQAKDFLAGDRRMNGILPNAVDQGRIAGMDMVGDSYLKPYAGGVALNTYHYFGHHAIAVGAATAADDVEIHESNGDGYRRIVMRDNQLLGVATIDQPLDAGVMWQLILRGTDLGDEKTAFLAEPVATGRRIMATTWG